MTQSDGPQPRRFGLADGLILIGAIAVALAWLRSLTYYEKFDYHMQGFVSRDYPRLYHVRWLYYYATPFLTTLTAGILILQLRGPRPALKTHIWRPGVSACLSASLGMVIGVACLLAEGTLSHWLVLPFLDQPSFVVRLWMAISDMTMRVGLIVVVVWLFGFVTKAPKEKANWLDWAGRVIGLFWILFTFAPFD